MFVPVNSIHIKEDGAVVFNLDSMESNVDWLRVARLLKQGEDKEVKEMDSNPMYREIKAAS